MRKKGALCEAVASARGLPREGFAGSSLRARADQGVRPRGEACRGDVGPESGQLPAEEEAVCQAQAAGAEKRGGRGGGEGRGGGGVSGRGGFGGRGGTRGNRKPGAGEGGLARPGARRNTHPR